MRVLVAVTVGLVVSCSSSDRDPGSEPDGSPVVVGTLTDHDPESAAVILLEPRTGSAAVSDPAPALMDQYAITFIPELLVVRVGQEVEFRNSEEIDHNVRAVDPAGTTIFNVSTPRGDPYRHRFATPGAYRIVCDIHPGMTASLLVVTQPYAAVVDSVGGFRLDGVPPGTYAVSVWRAGGPTATPERLVDVTAGRTAFDVGGEVPEP